jgi:hypothetical protein
LVHGNQKQLRGDNTMFRPNLVLAAAFLAASLAAYADAPPPGDGEDEIVCKRVEETGSRLKSRKICRTESEWKAMRDGAKDFMKDVDKGASTQPRDLGAGGS